MVVRDDKLHAELFAQRCLLICRDAAVDRDDQLHILRAQCAHGNLVEPVALFESGGNVACHMSAALAQKVREQTRRRDAVDIIVSEHADMLAPFECFSDPAHRLVHVQQIHGA